MIQTSLQITNRSFTQYDEDEENISFLFTPCLSNRIRVANETQREKERGAVGKTTIVREFV